MRLGLPKSPSLLLILLGMIGGCARLWADDLPFKVVANPSVRIGSISIDQLKQIFLIKTSRLPDGTTVIPIVEVGSRTSGKFAAQYLGRDEPALIMYYRSLAFSGRAFMPRLCSSEAELLTAIAHTSSAIGYVRADVPTPGLRTIAIR